ncbi:hypothetical protein NQZ68_023690 [Dissostichus eleginoides]|nr:hypothetical protein NQZ68_023690 [Dissostichus eleginoides]
MDVRGFKWEKERRRGHMCKQRVSESTSTSPIRLINGEQSQLHPSPHREFGAYGGVEICRIIISNLVSLQHSRERPTLKERRAL